MILKYENIAGTLCVVFPIAVLLDIALTWYATTKKIQIDHPYFNLHNRYGLKFITSFKIFLALVFLYLLLNPPGNAGALFFLIIVYFIVLLQLSYQVAKRKIS